MAFTIEHCPKCKQSMSAHGFNVADPASYACPPVKVAAGINREMAGEFVTAVYPSHLTCPYCPAQSAPDRINELTISPKLHLMAFVCPAKHRFYVQPEIKVAEPVQNFGSN